MTGTIVAVASLLVKVSTAVEICTLLIYSLCSMTKNPPQFAIHILWCVCLPVCVFVNIDVLCESVQIDQHVAVRSSPA